MMGGVDCPHKSNLKFPRRGTWDEVRTQELKTQTQIRMKIKVMTALQQDAAGNVVLPGLVGLGVLGIGSRTFKQVACDAFCLA